MLDRLVFVPLGGVGEIGMNVYLYGLDDSWLMVDLGISFADERLPGVDIVLPDIQFAEELGDKLKALVLTHAHEDHLGAVPYLWRQLRVPVCARTSRPPSCGSSWPSTGWPARCRSSASSRASRSRSARSPAASCSMTHSIPESGPSCSRRRFGRVLHTGDWKLDPEPLVGERSDVEERSTWASRACSRWCATAPTRSRPAPRAPRPRCGRA